MLAKRDVQLDAKEAWKGLSRELVEEGISNEDIELFKNEIRACIKHLKDQGDSLILIWT
jgi:hypothetical protein